MVRVGSPSLCLGAWLFLSPARLPYSENLELLFEACNIHKLGKKKCTKAGKGEQGGRGCWVVVMAPRRSLLLCTLPSGLLMAALQKCHFPLQGNWYLQYQMAVLRVHCSEHKYKTHYFRGGSDDAQVCGSRAILPQVNQ